MVDFEVHKLTIETLGEYLASVRREMGFSQAEVVAKVGIAPKVLTALEAAEWKSLPEAVYVVGFIKKLAALYGVAEGPLVVQFYRELAIAKKQEMEKQGLTWKVLTERIAPIRWTIGFSMLGTAVFIGLCVWQILAIGTVPRLSILTPAAGQKLEGSLVTVSGLATPGSEVALNGQTVYAGADGTFSSSVSLLPGAQSLTVSAKSRFNKVATKTVSFVVDVPQNTIPAGPEKPQAAVQNSQHLAESQGQKK
jgi:transcriptional regulator with XRE-family HTH domain